MYIIESIEFFFESLMIKLIFSFPNIILMVNYLSLTQSLHILVL